jgi:hypothetical protein
MKKNPHAQALGRLAKGKPKRFSKAEIARRKKRLAEARVLRWRKKQLTRRKKTK